MISNCFIFKLFLEAFHRFFVQGSRIYNHIDCGIQVFAFQKESSYENVGTRSLYKEQTGSRTSERMQSVMYSSAIHSWFVLNSLVS